MIGKAGTIFRQGNGASTSSINNSSSGGSTIFYEKNADKEKGDHEDKEELPVVSKSEIKKLDLLTNANTEYLYKAKSFFPLDLFPDQIIVDRKKITVITRSFFQTERVHSITFDAVSDVFIDTTPFFSTLRIIDKNFAEYPIVINNLPREEASKVRRIIQGLMVATNEQISLDRIPREELITRIESLGKGK